MPPEALPDDLASIWERVRGELRAHLPASTFQLWIEPLRPVSTQGNTLHLAAPDTTRTWVERRYSASVQAALRASAPGLERVVFLADDCAAGQGAPAERWTDASVESLALDPAHTFERFVIGAGNRLAHSAALAVAELPGEAYNPLFLHGPPGLGKTHLLGAIADYLGRRHPELTVHYTTAERFTTEFVGGLRKDGPERFKQRYRKLDALLIDDVQVLEGKERTQEEFVNTFNALHAAGKQIVLSSDRPPEAITRVAERLRDRFGWGLRAELGCPDLPTRTALLWRMTLETPLELGDPAALKEIAARVLGNVRRLQGAMTRVAAFSSMLSEPVTPSLATRALDPSASGDCPRSSDTAPPVVDSPSVDAIQEAVCSVRGVSRQDLLSAKRTSRISHARQLAMYLTRQETSLSLAQIAREFNRDHTTVLHAIRKVSTRLAPESETAAVLHRTCELLAVGPNNRTPQAALVHHTTSPPQTASTNASRTPLP
ncbi:MAG: chromosomal replication initiator protein DnaA [Actinomycetota bacterium]